MQRVGSLVVAPPGVLDAGAVLEATTGHVVPGVEVDLLILGATRGVDGCEVGRAVVPAPVFAQPLAIGNAVIFEVVNDARAREDGLETEAQLGEALITYEHTGD